MSTPEDVSVESVGSRAAAPPSPAHSYCIESLSLSGSGRLSQAHYRVDERTSLVTPTNPRKKRLVTFQFVLYALNTSQVPSETPFGGENT